MSALDDVTAAVQASTKIDDGSKAVLLDFLQAGAPVLQSLEAGALQDLMGWLAGAGFPPPPAVDQLTSAQVSALLTVTQQEMAGLLDDRLKEVASARAAIGNLGDAALSILVRALIAAL